MLPTSAIPGHLVGILSLSDPGPFACHVAQTGDEQPLPVAAAQQGFQALTDEYFDKLLELEKVLDGVAKRDCPKGVLAKTVFDQALHPRHLCTEAC